jgi:uncharacterized protein
MASTTSERRRPRQSPAPAVVKIVVAGGFGAGKTTFIESISDIEPISTEVAMSALAGELGSVPGKDATTVTMDFGRITLSNGLWLYLFGTPGQDRFAFLWDDIARGAVGAVVLVDSERLEQSFGAVDYFESRGLPFVVAVNCFDGLARHTLADIRGALAIGPDVPLFYTDARSREATKDSLIQVVAHAMNRLAPRVTTPAPQRNVS